MLHHEYHWAGIDVKKMTTPVKRLHPLIYPLTIVGTAGYLGTSTSQPDLFILGDENVIHPLTGVPCTLSTYSERVISTSFKKESFQICRFIEGKDHPLDVLTGNDEKFVATVATMLQQLLQQCCNTSAMAPWQMPWRHGIVATMLQHCCNNVATCHGIVVTQVPWRHGTILIFH